jgi:pyruvate kinase
MDYYHIVVTLGPASDSESIWHALLAAGATAFRLNSSHLSLPQLRLWVERLAEFLAPLQPKPGLILDLQGSKWRLGRFPACELRPGQQVELVCTSSADRPNLLPVPHPDFFEAAAISSGEIALNDARVRLALESAEPDSLKGRVIQGGELVSNKGITFTASDYRRESLNQKDQTILAETEPLAFVRYALSYVKDQVEMARYRALIGPAAYLIAKLERQPAVGQAREIAAEADELWLCRGDLGAELGGRAMAETVHRFSEQVRELPGPVMLAGQVLEHMTGQPTPTRSELCYLHDALAKGYQGFVLSDETAVGQYPVESCRAAALFRG